MQCNNGCGEHIRYIKKSKKSYGSSVGSGRKTLERRHRDDHGTQFKALIESIMMYGAEIWGWAEQGELQKIITNCWRWVLGVKWNVPVYIVQEEVDEEQLWANTWGRAYEYEWRLRQVEDGGWITVCAN